MDLVGKLFSLYFRNIADIQYVCESVVYIQKVADMQLQCFKMGLPQLSPGFRVGICWYLTQLEIILDPNRSKSGSGRELQKFGSTILKVFNHSSAFLVHTLAIDRGHTDMQ